MVLPDPGAAFDAALGNPRDTNAYMEAHRELLRRETESAWDRDAKPPPWSQSQEHQTERKAALILQAIREYERRVTFGNLASEAVPGTDTRDMGGQFLTNKERIDTESKLYEIAKMVPKAALLHVHFNTILPPERILEQARHVDNMYIRSIRPLLTQKDLDETEVVFMVLDKDLVEADVNIFSNDYPGGPTNWKTEEWKYRVWMPWSKFRNEFNIRFGNNDKQQQDTSLLETPVCCAESGKATLCPAEKWLESKIMLNQEEEYGLTQTTNGIWARFNQATRCFKGLFNYEGAYKWYISKAIDHMIAENIMYAELRPVLIDRSIPKDDGKQTIDNFAQMQLLIHGVREKQADLAKRNMLHRFPFGLKIIYCAPRSIAKGKMREEMKHCIELKRAFPELICGFDLVGAEDRPHHIGYYKEELLAFRKTCKQYNLDIPFLFHAGETLLDTGGSTEPQNSNLYDAILLQSKRIGHGFALLKHPELIREFKKTEEKPGICIELCPISNELLHLCRNVKEHRFAELLAAGVPCTINTDNPSMFRNSMSHEFYQVMVGAPTMSLYSWKQLARWSIDYSCLSEQEQRQGHEIYDRSWGEFCQEVVDKYGGLMAGDEIDEEKARQLYSQRRGPALKT